MATQIIDVEIINSTLDNSPIGSTNADTARFITPATNDNSTNAATTAWVRNLLGNGLVSGNGYLILPNGLIFQWGAGPTIGGGSTANITFPIAFPTAAFTVLVTAQHVTGQHSSTQSMVNGTLSTSGFTVVSGTGTDTDGNAPFNWFAIGN